MNNNVNKRCIFLQKTVARRSNIGQINVSFVQKCKNNKWNPKKYEETQISNKPKSFRVGSACFVHSAKKKQTESKKYKQSQTLNKPRIGINPKVLLAPQKQLTEFKKYELIQTWNFDDQVINGCVTYECVIFLVFFLVLLCRLLFRRDTYILVALNSSKAIFVLKSS